MFHPIDGEMEAQRMRGTILWFNEVKDVGVVVADDGEQLPVGGEDFKGGIRPEGRCATAPVAFEVETSPERRAVRVELIAREDHGRARLRHNAMRIRS